MLSQNVVNKAQESMARGYSPPATALAIKPAITPRFDSFPTEALSRQTVGMDKQAKRHGSPKYDPAHMAWAVQKSYRCRDAEAKDVQLVLLKFGRWPRVACKGTHGPKQPMPNSNPPTKLRALIGVVIPQRVNTSVASPTSYKNLRSHEGVSQNPSSASCKTA